MKQTEKTRASTWAADRAMSIIYCSVSITFNITCLDVFLTGHTYCINIRGRLCLLIHCLIIRFLGEGRVFFTRFLSTIALLLIRLSLMMYLLMTFKLSILLRFLMTKSSCFSFVYTMLQNVTPCNSSHEYVKFDKLLYAQNILCTPYRSWIFEKKVEKINRC